MQEFPAVRDIGVQAGETRSTKDAALQTLATLDRERRLPTRKETSALTDPVLGVGPALARWLAHEDQEAAMASRERAGSPEGRGPRGGPGCWLPNA